MSEAAEIQEESCYTYNDYLKTDEDYRAEIVDGHLYVSTPPSRYHQGIGRNLLVKIALFLEGKPGKVYPAPFGVRPFPKTDLSDDIYFEPDITVICDTSKLDDRGCNGAPDMIIEILRQKLSTPASLRVINTGSPYTMKRRPRRSRYCRAASSA
jgi:Uma2 family endonuclease